MFCRKTGRSRTADRGFGTERRRFPGGSRANPARRKFPPGNSRGDGRSLSAGRNFDGSGRIVFIGQTGLPRSEEHTSELQSREKLVCRLLLEKKKRPKGGR